MTQHRQTNFKESKAKQPTETKPQSPELVAEQAGPAELPLALTNGLMTNPGAALNHPGLLAAQRHSLALKMGQTQGNQYLQRAITSQKNDQSSVQRLFEKRSERQIIEEAIRDESGLDILSLNGNFQAATPQEKFKLIDITLTKTLVVSDPIRYQLKESLKSDLPGLAQAEKLGMISQLSNFKSYTHHLYRIGLIYDIWHSFGNDTAAMIELVSQPDVMALWKKSDDMDVDLDELPFVEKLTGEFEIDISSLTSKYLHQNLEHIEKEMQRLGLNDMGLMDMLRGEDQESAITEEYKAEMQTTQKIAGRVAEAQQAQQGLRQIPVGYKYRMQSYPFFLTTDTVNRYYEVAYFDPEQKPIYTAQELGKEKETNFADWQKIKKSHDELEQVITSLGDRFPAIFAVQQNDKPVQELAQADYFKARQMVAQSLMTVRGNIHNTIPKIGDDISVYDLEPIQAQLIQGKLSHSGRAWNQPFLKWVAQKAKSEHESREFWISLGLGSLAAAAFAFATLASGGTAAVLFAGGLAAGGAQAAISWERYLDLAEASKTNVRSDLAIVSRGQVNAALLSAILDTAFALLDVYAPAKAGIQALRGGSKVVGEMARAGATAGGRALEGLDALRALGKAESAVAGDAVSQLEKRALIEQVVTEVGIEETLRRSGKSIDELIELAGADSAVAKQLNYYRNLSQNLLSPQELVQKLNKIKSGQALDTLENDRVLMQLLEQQGPVSTLREGGGWQQLAGQLDAYTLTGQRLYAWRDQLWQELEAVLNQGSSGYVTRAASEGGLGHRLTIEFVGENALENSQKARSYLAGRVGVDVDEVEKLLNTAITANPSASGATKVTLPGAKSAASSVDEVSDIMTPAWGQMDEVTEVTTPIGVGNKGGKTKVMDAATLEDLTKKSKDKNLDFNREPTQGAKDTPPDVIKEWVKEGAKHGVFTTAEEMTEYCVRVFRRPIEPIEHLYFHNDWASFVGALRQHHPNHNVSNGLLAFYDPATRFIHVGPNVTEMASVFHEAVHKMAYLLRPRVRRELGTFLDEGITEWLARIHSAGRIGGSGYNVNVEFVQRLARVLGYDTVSNTLVHGNVDELWAAVTKALGGDDRLTSEFFSTLHNINNGVGMNMTELAKARSFLDQMEGITHTSVDDAADTLRMAGKNVADDAADTMRIPGKNVANEAAEVTEVTKVRQRPDSQPAEAAKPGPSASTASQTAAGLPAYLPAPGSMLAQGTDREIVFSVYVATAKANAPYGVEVGLYRRLLPNGEYEYLAQQGTKGRILGPAGKEWETVAHFHPDAAKNPAFRYPAPADIDSAAAAYGWDDKLIQETVHSLDPNGKLIAVNFGFDPKRLDTDKLTYFVDIPGEGRLSFVSTYPKNDASLAQAIAKATNLDPEKQLPALLDVFINLDPTRYYAGWWAKKVKEGMQATPVGP